MERPDQRDGKSRPEDIREPMRAQPAVHRSVLDATSVRPEKSSALRWLFLVVLLMFIVLAGGYVVRSVLDRLTSPVVGRLEPHRGPAPPESPKFPWVPEAATQPPLQPASSALHRNSDEPWPFNAAEITSRIVNADLRNGRAVFTVCAICHMAERAAEHRLGPKLWNIMGREKASYSDYAYSQALKAQGGRWTYEELARYLYDTRTAIPGGKMAFAGIRDPAKLADVIAFKRTLAAKPVPLPKG
jgi:cytochrome c